ncbi:MAG: hypothetical protein Q9227_007616 [Pyrenula ochraceoflavens]
MADAPPIDETIMPANPEDSENEEGGPAHNSNPEDTHKSSRLYEFGLTAPFVKTKRERYFRCTGVDAGTGGLAHDWEKFVLSEKCEVPCDKHRPFCGRCAEKMDKEAMRKEKEIEEADLDRAYGDFYPPDIEG